MIDVNPTSQRWKEICEIEDEQTQRRAIRRYVFELEKQLRSYETELNNLRKEVKEAKEDILCMKIVTEEIQKIVKDEYQKYNTDWGSMQKGF